MRHFGSSKNKSYFEFGSRFGYWFDFFPFLGDTSPPIKITINLYFYSSKLPSYFSWIQFKNLQEPARVRLLGSLLLENIMLFLALGAEVHVITKSLINLSLIWDISFKSGQIWQVLDSSEKNTFDENFERFWSPYIMFINHR